MTLRDTNPKEWQRLMDCGFVEIPTRSSASVIGSKPSEAKPYGHPSWAHFSDDDTEWFSDLFIPSWAIFAFGLGLGAALAWLVI